MQKFVIFILLSSALICRADVNAPSPDGPFRARLFQHSGQIAPEYNQLIRTVMTRLYEKPRAPVTLEFANGVSFGAQKILGGDQHLILDIGDGKVLRIRKWRKRLTGFEWNGGELSYNTAVPVHSMRQYRRGYEALRKDGVPVVQILSTAKTDGQYFVIERVEALFTYEQFVNAPDQAFDSRFGLDPATVDDQFIAFAKKTAAYARIGDFRGDQLVYTTAHGWILLDWTDEHVRARMKPSDTRNIFVQDAEDDARNSAFRFGFNVRTYKPGLPERLKVRTLNAIQQARAGCGAYL